MLMSSQWEEGSLCGCWWAVVMEVVEVGGEGSHTQVGNTDAGGGTVQSPCLNLHTNAA